MISQNKQNNTMPPIEAVRYAPDSPDSGSDEPLCEVFPPFLLNDFPHALLIFSIEAAQVNGVPYEIAAMCCLATASAAIGSKLRVSTVHGKTTSANIMVLIGAESGSGKSETFRDCMIPFKDCAEKLRTEWKREILPKAKAEERVLKQEIDKLGKTPDVSAEARDGNLKQITEKEQRLALVQEMMKVPTYVASNVTTPALIKLLCQMGGQMFTASPDAKDFVDMVLGRYTKGHTDEEVYLKGFSLESLDRHRVGEGSQSTDEACITGLWLTQPEKIERLVAERAMTEGGLLPRILTMIIPCSPLRVCMEQSGISAASRSKYNTIITELFHAYLNQKQVHIIEADDAARKVLVEYQNSIADRQEQELSDVKAFAARWGEYSWRFALVCHAIRHGKNAHQHSLCLNDARMGIAITEYAAAQQLDVLSRSRDQLKNDKHAKIMKLLQKKPYITARDVYRARITSDGGNKESQDLLEEMTEKGFLKRTEGSTARRNHTQYLYTAA